MEMNHDEFKDNAEGLATKQFLPAYNSLHSTHFEVVDSDDVAPDVYCVDSQTGEQLNLKRGQKRKRGQPDIYVV